MSKAYQFPDDPQRPNPFADSTPPVAGASDNPYAASQIAPDSAAPGAYYQTTPHRGGMLLALGILGLLGVLISVALAFCCLPLGALNLGLTIPAWLMARQDLKAIAAGAVDPAGRGLTQAAFILGICGTIGNFVSLCIAGGLFASVYFSD